MYFIPVIEDNLKEMISPLAQWLLEISLRGYVGMDNRWMAK